MAWGRSQRAGASDALSNFGRCFRVSPAKRKEALRRANLLLSSGSCRYRIDPPPDARTAVSSG